MAYEINGPDFRLLERQMHSYPVEKPKPKRPKEKVQSRPKVQAPPAAKKRAKRAYVPPTPFSTEPYVQKYATDLQPVAGLNRYLVNDLTKVDEVKP